VGSHGEWVSPDIVVNGLLNGCSTIPLIKDSVKSVQLCGCDTVFCVLVRLMPDVTNICSRITSILVNGNVGILFNALYFR
jgi:hypothetical protein